ncbi:PREDICTED: uncharacterized protein LOC109185008 [Ipomoea nil]|uniref:uncharacterized protein LOC109183140 n=1 Tax=Ipomoea nil TaxID=35883 RepID=UPI000900BB45|nr:PREDICTED: uncharacterized protein LOC109183140 [Ipomoea nil]XP_019190550.1 PREDICTED: uncharacterized protein LOC109185008 [Ipomoea nil]
MINELPTILEVVSGKAVEPPKHNPKLLNDDTQQPKRKWSTPQPRNWKDEAIVRGKSLLRPSGPAAPAMASSQARVFPVQFEDPSTLLASHRQIAASLQATITGLENLLGTHLNEIARLEGMARILANNRTSDSHNDASTDSD